MKEFRRVPVSEFRAVEGTDGKEFWARVLRYGVRDDYGTRFRSGLFDEQLGDGDWPPLLYGHNWMDLEAVLGRWAEQRSETAAAALDLRGVFDDFDAVPKAKQASVQLRSGTLKEFSVGFTRLEDRRAEDDHSTIEITEAYLDEVSIVPRGAVPGTKLLQLRDSGLLVPAQVAAEVLTKLGAGTIDLADALATIKGTATAPPAPEPTTTPPAPVTDPGETPPEPPEATPPPEPAELPDDVLEELEDALALVDGRA